MRLGFQNKKQKVILFVLGLEMLILLVLIGTLFIPEKSYVLSDRENSITLPYGHYFLNCEYYVYYFLCEQPCLRYRSLACSLSNITICVPKNKRIV